MKRQGQIVAATITNFGAVEEALKNMENSAGSAEAEMETIRNSAEYAMNALKETFTSLAQHSVSRGGLKDLINAGTKILEIVDGIVSKVGLLPALISSIVGIVSAKSSVKSNLLSFSLNDKNKIGLNFLGAQVGKGWSERVNALRQESVDLKNAIQVLYSEMDKGTQNSTKFKNAFKTAMNSNNEAIKIFAKNAKKGIATSNDLSKAINSVGKSSKTSAIFVNILNTALSMIASAGISIAINALFKSFSDGINAVKNNISEIKNLTDNISSLEGDLNGLQEKLKETKTRIKELQDLSEKKPLNLLEQDELNRLQKYNDELERQIRLKRGEISQAVSEKNKEAQDLWENSNKLDIFKSRNYQDMLPGIGQLIALSTGKKVDWAGVIPGLTSVRDLVNDISKGVNKEFFSQQTKDLEKYKKQLEEIEKLKNTDAYKNGDKKTTDKVEKAQKKLDELHDKIQKYYNDTWTTLSTGLDPNLKENQKILEQVNAVIDEWDRLNGHTNTTFEELYNDAHFSTVRQELEQLAKEGKLTADVFERLTDNDISGVEEFKKALSEIPNIKVEDVINTINEAIKDTGNNADKASQSIKLFKDELDELYERLKGIVSKQEKLAEAFKKTALGGALAAKEVLDLIEEMPALAKYLKEIDGGYTISEEGFAALSEENLNQEREKLNNKIEETKKQIRFLQEYRQAGLDLENANVGNDVLTDPQVAKKKEEDALRRFQWYADLTEQIRKDLNVNGWADLDRAISELQESLNGNEFSYNLITEAFDAQKLAIEGVSAAYDEVKSKVNDYNKDIQSIDSAIKNLNEGMLLSYDEMNAIVELSPGLEDYFQKQENGYSISIDKLEELREQSYETRNKYIQDVRARVQADINAANVTRTNIEKEIEDLKQMGINGAAAAIQFAELNKSLGDVDERLKLYAEILEKLDGLERDITYSNDNKNSLADEMQRRIDYYNTILAAVEAVKNKYTEAIDTEIDALEEGKDALKESNDERQRELDLIEARNNLENAKKRKVWVYNDADGFKQVQDKKALADAEKEYSDAIQNVQEAEIDKQIDALEKQKEALEKQVKDLTDLQNQIENGKTIEQALSALGLSDERDLLNLSDSVKQGIKEGLTEAILTKEKEDNKDNNQYISVTLDDILNRLGATVTPSDISGLDLITKSAFDNAVNNFAVSLKEYRDTQTGNVVNNNSGTVISPTFNISGVTDPKEVAKVVNDEMTNLFTKLNNSIK